MHSLLPQNATPLERSLEIDRFDGLADPVRDTMSAERIDLARLPWLAWGLNVDAWDDDWPEALKRDVVRKSILHHRQKGTLAGMRRAARLGNAQLIDAFLPADRAFLSPAPDDAARRAWLERYPELRIYRKRSRGTRAGMMPVGAFGPLSAKVFLGGGAHYGTAFPAMGTAMQRTLPRVFRVAADGTETELTTAVIERGTRLTEVLRIERTVAQRGRVTTEIGEERVFQIVGPALRGKGAIFGDPGVADAPVKTRLFLGAGRYMAHGRAHLRTFLTKFRELVEMPGASILARAVVQPLLDRQSSGIDVTLQAGDVMTARADLVAQPGKAEGFFPSRGWWGRWLIDHYPGERMYASSRIYDPAVPLPPQSGFFFCGVTRLRMPAYHAEIKLSIRRRRTRRAFGRYMRGYLVASSNPMSKPLMQSLRTTAPMRDKVLLNTKTFGPLTAGGNKFAGPIRVAGQWSEIT